MIEEISDGKSLFKEVRKEGTVIKQGDTYWEYEIEYEGCERCGTDIERKGWRNINHIVKQFKPSPSAGGTK
jgi:hypothetical protein